MIAGTVEDGDRYVQGWLGMGTAHVRQLWMVVNVSVQLSNLNLLTLSIKYCWSLI